MMIIIKFIELNFKITKNWRNDSFETDSLWRIKKCHEISWNVMKYHEMSWNVGWLKLNFIFWYNWSYSVIWWCFG
jgi:hypothetical protein